MIYYDVLKIVNTGHYVVFTHDSGVKPANSFYLDPSFHVFSQWYTDFMDGRIPLDKAPEKIKTTHFTSEEYEGLTFSTVTKEEADKLCEKSKTADVIWIAARCSDLNNMTYEKFGSSAHFYTLDSAELWNLFYNRPSFLKILHQVWEKYEAKYDFRPWRADGMVHRDFMEKINRYTPNDDFMKGLRKYLLDYESNKPEKNRIKISEND